MNLFLMYHIPGDRIPFRICHPEISIVGERCKEFPNCFKIGVFVRIFSKRMLRLLQMIHEDNDEIFGRRAPMVKYFAGFQHLS